MVRVLLHWEIRFECSDRLDAAEFRCCLHYVGCLVLFFPININSFNTLCQRWAALSFFLSTLIDSTHYDRGGLAGRMLERGWSIPPLPPTSIYYFALSITIFTIFYSVLLLLYYCSIYYTFSQLLLTISSQTGPFLVESFFSYPFFLSFAQLYAVQITCYLLYRLPLSTCCAKYPFGKNVVYVMQCIIFSTSCSTVSHCPVCSIVCAVWTVSTGHCSVRHLTQSHGPAPSCPLPLSPQIHSTLEFCAI